MPRVVLAVMAAALAAGTIAAPAGAQAPPLYATTKVEGTDNVYIFRYQGHQSMFVVTPAGVIATALRHSTVALHFSPQGTAPGSAGETVAV